MERRRTIAAAPIRTASEAWRVVVQLLADTLERSDAVPEGSVATELAPLDGLGPALIAAGHIEKTGLVLVDEGMHLTILAATGDSALDVEENLNPVPGGVGATPGWMLHLPTPDPLRDAVTAAAKKSSHLTTDEPPETAQAETKTSSRDALVDVEAIRRLGSSR